MADQENSPNPNPRIPSLCDECGSNPWKYRCPGCSIKSCSLPCVKSHKERTRCGGKRSRTEFVPLSEFDDDLLISDYNLLEETKRIAESARRMAAAIGGFRGYVGYRLPVHLQKLRNAANLRKIRLLLLPPGMSKRKMNLSRYDPRKKSIFWTIEWRFHSTDVVLVDHGIDEHTSLASVIEKHLAPSPLKSQLSPYCNVQLDDLRFFLRKNPKGIKSPFRELNIRAPVGQQLEDVLVLEYPIIFIFLPSHNHDFEVEKVAKPSSKWKEAPVSMDSAPSPKGTLFVEEDIQEDEVPVDTLVTDLADHSVPEEVGHDSDMQEPNKKHQPSLREGAKMCTRYPLNLVKSSPHYNSQISQQNETAAAVVSASHMQISGAGSEGSKPVVSQNCVASPAGEADMAVKSEDAKPDFQQELRTVYSELLGDMNPDDFLCFDGECSEIDNLKLLCGVEELEEGEIPDH